MTDALKPVSVITVAYDGVFWVRLLVEKVREFVGERQYEILVVDRGSRDGTQEWLKCQHDVRLIKVRQWRSHRHGEAAEAAIHRASHPYIVLLDSDAHPTSTDWLTLTVDRLDTACRLAGATFRDDHKGNPFGWYIHPHFMAFHREDLGRHIILRKMRGHDTDTGEEATIRLLEAGLGITGYPIELCERFVVGHDRVPTEAAGVFHAWYVTRLMKDPETVARETDGAVTPDSYLAPLQARLREFYGLDY